VQGVAAHLLGVRYRVRPDLVTRRCTFCVDAVVSDQPPVPPPSGKVADETAARGACASCDPRLEW